MTDVNHDVTMFSKLAQIYVREHGKLQTVEDKNGPVDVLVVENVVGVSISQHHNGIVVREVEFCRTLVLADPLDGRVPYFELRLVESYLPKLQELLPLDALAVIE